MCNIETYIAKPIGLAIVIQAIYNSEKTWLVIPREILHKLQLANLNFNSRNMAEKAIKNEIPNVTHH